MVLIPKKGDLTECDNWYGINLLNVMGKLFSKVIQRRLQWVTKEVLLDSQCGFHSGRDCVDVVFCAQQLVEKASEHSTKIYKSCSFVVFRKAFNSVP